MFKLKKNELLSGQDHNVRAESTEKETAFAGIVAVAKAEYVNLLQMAQLRCEEELDETDEDLITRARELSTAPVVMPGVRFFPKYPLGLVKTELLSARQLKRTLQLCKFRGEPIDEAVLAPFLNYSSLNHHLYSAFLFKMFAETLAEKRIGLMPTLKSDESIDADQFESAILRGVIEYTTDVLIDDQTISPLKESKFFHWDMHYLAYPVELLNGQMGLLLLDVATAVSGATYSIGGYFIEPLASVDEGRAELARITKNLLIPAQAIKTISFSKPDLRRDADNDNDSTDYIFALLARLVSSPIDYRVSHPDLGQMAGDYLSLERIQAIRMLQISMFGANYFWYQAPEISRISFSIDERSCLNQQIFKVSMSQQAIECGSQDTESTEMDTQEDCPASPDLRTKRLKSPVMQRKQSIYGDSHIFFSQMSQVVGELEKISMQSMESSSKPN